MQLGTKVQAKAILKLVKKRRGGYIKRRWERVEGIRYGVLVGFRTLREGDTQGYSDHTEFTTTRYIRAVLIAVNLRQIVRVLPEDVDVL